MDAINYDEDNTYGTIRKRKGSKPLPAGPLRSAPLPPSPTGPILPDYSTPSKRTKKPLPRAPGAGKENSDSNRAPGRPVSCSKLELEKDEVRKVLPLPTSPGDTSTNASSPSHVLSPKQRRISKGGKKKSMSPNPRPRIVSGRYDTAVYPLPVPPISTRVLFMKRVVRRGVLVRSAQQFAFSTQGTSLHVHSFSLSLLPFSFISSCLLFSLSSPLFLHFLFQLVLAKETAINDAEQVLTTLSNYQKRIQRLEDEDSPENGRAVVTKVEYDLNVITKVFGGE